MVNNILIYADDDLSIGSNRIFAFNLYQDLLSLGLKVDCGTNFDPTKYDCVIYGKGKTKNLKFDQTSKIKGLIQPTDFSKKLLEESLCADFWIVRSYDEMDHYLSYKKEIFLFPLIERYKISRKYHEDKDEIIIGYHGNKLHLETLSPNIVSALEKISSNYKIRFKAIYDIKKLGLWHKSRPKINIQDIQWTFENMNEFLSSVDIGITPFLSPMPIFYKAIAHSFTRLFYPNIGFNPQNIFLHYKNTTNAGRIFVFQQAGIPVVAELCPAATSAIPNEQYGFIAYETEGWFRAIELLCKDALLRNKISQNAYTFFSTTHDIISFSKKIANKLTNFEV